jgi:hypothetical protein
MPNFSACGSTADCAAEGGTGQVCCFSLTGFATSCVPGACAIHVHSGTDGIHGPLLREPRSRHRRRETRRWRRGWRRLRITRVLNAI